MSLRQHTPRSSRSLTLLAAGALLAAPLLSSCGFDYATDRVNTISGGINDRDGDVDVLGAVVVAGEDDRGLFVGTFANNSTTEPAALAGMAQGTDDAAIAPIESDVAVDIPAAGRVNLYDTGGIPVQGSFGAGDFVDVVLNFESGQVTTIQVPVVTPCHQYSPEQLPNLELPTAAGDEPVTTEESGTEESEDAEAHGTTDPYSCEPAVEAEGDEEH